jgi:hypothetical protein
MSQVFQWKAGQSNGGNPITKSTYDGPVQPTQQETPQQESTEEEVTHE